ncbi:hypothetical protein [Bacteroides sp.]|uniref:hypothetical protein n=1 Tax=Bacteroides sp. TaxID=29523 RepID=UPI00261FC450|nr:hypothetical protein [Bacteroides sp.]MDD3040023.1 hypothetical protein [Bacteroides sp.]
MSKFYAQLNIESICVGVSQLSGSIDGNLINLDFMDTSIVGKKYNNGTWEEVPVEPVPEPPLTEMEQTVLETSLNVEYLMCSAELNN